jgi:hypothetical protein
MTISSITAAPPAAAVQSSAPKAQAPAAAAAETKGTVHLSAEAVAASKSHGHHGHKK